MKNFMIAMVLGSMVFAAACSNPASDPTPVTHTVTYDLNGYTGTAPVDSKAYLNGDTVAVAANLADIDANNTFSGWSLSTNGATTFTFIMGSTNVTLYAQWIKVDQAVTFTDIANKDNTSHVYQRNGIGSYYHGTEAVDVHQVYVDDASTTYINNEFRVIGRTWNLSYGMDVAGYADLPPDHYFYHEDQPNSRVWFVEEGSSILGIWSIVDTTKWNPISIGRDGLGIYQYNTPWLYK